MLNTADVDFARFSTDSFIAQLDDNDARFKFAVEYRDLTNEIIDETTELRAAWVEKQSLAICNNLTSETCNINNWPMEAGRCFSLFGIY